MKRRPMRRAVALFLENLEGRALLSATAAKPLLVGFSGDVPSRSVEVALDRFNARITESFPDGPRVVELPAGADLQAAVRTLYRLPGVRYVEPDATISVDAFYTNDPMLGSLWGLNNGNDIDVDAPEAWEVDPGSPGTIVAVVDSGLDRAHPDLNGRVWVNRGEIANNGRDDDGNGYVDDVNGWNFLNRNNDLRDLDGHGTHVAGTIAATASNSLGVVGVAPGVLIMPLKFIGSNGEGSITDAVSAIYYAVNNGARVINASWGSPDDSKALDDAIAFANTNGVVFVTAAGNESANNDVVASYPPSIRLPNVLSVAAVDRDGNLADFSNYGPGTVDIAAPGVDILSTIPGGGYASKSGTSMATPHVSAVVALVADRNPRFTAAQLVERVRVSAKPDAQLTGKTITGGIVSAYRALTYGTTTSKAPTTNTPPPASYKVADLHAVILASDEFYAVHGGTSEGFLDGLYRAVLGRPVDPYGLAGWTDLLQQGGTRDQVVAGILSSTEAYRTTVARWFVENLGRPAWALESLKNDPTVVQWGDQLAGGVREDVILGYVLGSEEFYVRNGGTPEGLVDGLYRSLLGRPPDPYGWASWTGALQQGGTRDQVVAGIMGTSEARRTTFARWFASDLKRPGPLEILKTDPTVVVWAGIAVF